MTISRILGIAVLAAASVFTGLTGCDRQPSTPAGASGTHGGKEPIVIGAYLSLTGPTATFGRTTREGIELATNQRNAAGGIGGRPIKMLILDTQGKSQETGTVVERLITSDHVVALLGEVASSLSLAAAPIAQQYSVPLISPSSTNPAVTKVGDMIFRTCFIDPDQGYSMALFATKNLKATKAAILFDQKQAYSVGLKDAFNIWFPKLGGTVTTVESYSSGDADYNAQLSRIKETKPDIIYVPGYYTEVGSIARQARQLGITAPLAGGDGWESPKLAEIGGKALDGCYFSNHYAPEDKSPKSVAFVEDYKKAYGVTPGALAALGYDAANLLFDTLAKNPGVTAKELAKALAQTSDYPAVTGTLTMGPGRDPLNKAMVILEMKDGEPAFVARIEPPKE